jgi:hypothetical protein
MDGTVSIPFWPTPVGMNIYRINYLVYIQNMWNGFDLAFAAIFLAFLGCRCRGLVKQDFWWNDLAVGGPLLKMQDPLTRQCGLLVRYTRM